MNEEIVTEYLRSYGIVDCGILNIGPSISLDDLSTWKDKLGKLKKKLRGIKLHPQKPRVIQMWSIT